MASRRNRLYAIWINMKGRCFNQNRPDYKYYGGRGITVCDEWNHCFSCFEKWAKLSGYNCPNCGALMDGKEDEHEAGWWKDFL